METCRRRRSSGRANAGQSRIKLNPAVDVQKSQVNSEQRSGKRVWNAGLRPDGSYTASAPGLRPALQAPGRIRAALRAASQDVSPYSCFVHRDLAQAEGSWRKENLLSGRSRGRRSEQRVMNPEIDPIALMACLVKAQVKSLGRGGRNFPHDEFIRGSIALLAESFRADMEPGRGASGRERWRDPSRNNSRTQRGSLVAKPFLTVLLDQAEFGLMGAAAIVEGAHKNKPGGTTWIEAGPVVSRRREPSGQVCPKNLKQGLLPKVADVGGQLFAKADRSQMQHRAVRQSMHEVRLARGEPNKQGDTCDD